MSAFVLDCSVTMSWCFHDEFDSYSASIQDALRENTALVPALWLYEVANVLKVGQRRKRLTVEDCNTFLDAISRLPIEIVHLEGITSLKELLGLAEQMELSVYDVAYLDVARRYDLPLATRDSRLADAARAINLPLYTFPVSDNAQE